MIEIQNLTKRYGNFLAVDNLTFSVAKGEILGLLGPNGAGKTTIIRILTGYLSATEGTVKIAGFDVLEESLQAKQSIGYLPESTPLYSQMRVKNYLKFMAELRKVPRAQIKQKTSQVLEKCWLTDVQDKIIAKLSKGYRQRVGIAQALVHDPAVLILDEPTIGLDPKQIIQMRKLIKDLKDHHTVILSSHILPEVSATCDRVVILNKGKLMAEDTPQDLAKLVKGTKKILVQAIGPGEEIKAALEKLEGVDQVQVTGENSYQVESHCATDLRGKISQLMAENKWELQELQSRNVSLEDVFLHLTTQEEEAES